MCSQTMGALTTGVFLVGFAVSLGANNAVIGVLGALPFLGNLLQLPAVLLIERLRKRKAIVCTANVLGRAVLPLIALIPLLPGRELQLVALVTGVAVHGAFGAISNCAWTSVDA